MQETKIDVDTNVVMLGTRDQFAKVILATTAGFIANKAMETLYVTLVKRRLLKTS